MSDRITEQPSGPRVEPLEIRYEIDTEDHVALKMYLYAHGTKLPTLPFASATLLLAAVFLLVLAGVVFALSFLGPFYAPLRGYAVVVGVVAVVALIFIIADFGGVLYQHDLKQLAHHARSGIRQRIAQGDVRTLVRAVVRLDAEGFTEVTTWNLGEPGFRQDERKETSASWWLVDHAGLTEEHVFLQVKGKGFLIVPRDAFADEVALRAFLDAVEGWRRAARRPVPAADTRITT
jgi:hypothetical protein